MKKETFVKLIKLCENYKKKCTNFGETIQKAYIEAGLERDFAPPISYAYPYGPLIDEMVKALAIDFADSVYTQEQAEDFINWWIWETDFGHETYMDISNGVPVKRPRAEVTIGDKTYIIKTPSQLYDVIVRDKKGAEKKL